MKDEDEALKLARAYLRWIVLGISTTDGVDGQATSGVEVDKAIKEALAQPVQKPLTVYQRIAISEQCVNLEFDDDFLNDICKVIILVEAAHNIGEVK